MPTRRRKPVGINPAIITRLGVVNEPISPYDADWVVEAATLTGVPQLIARLADS